MTLSTSADPSVLAPAARSEKNLTKLIIATSIGNALEWYDISVYAYFAVYVSKAFFPNDDATVSLLLALGTFGLTFMIRPIGGVLLGTYADRHGRRASLMVSIVMMTLGTLAMALMPTYATIGVLAPIGVMLARLVQGFSAGGEFGSSTAFLVEHEPERRGFLASWQFASQGFSAVLASTFGVLLTSSLSPADMQAWGWRVAFLFGALIGPIGIYIRNHLQDATEPPAASHESPAKTVFTQQKLRTVLSIGVLAVSTAVNYLIVYMPTYAVKTLGLPPVTGFIGTLLGGITVTLVTPFAGIVSDRIGRTTHMLVLGVLMLLSIFPSFLLIKHFPTAVMVVSVTVWLAFLKGTYSGALAAIMSELFPPETRATGLGLSYNVGVTAFGGMGPAIMTALGTIAVIGDLAPGYYLSFVALLTLWSLVEIRRRALA